jgi:hypothetical protein
MTYIRNNKTLVFIIAILLLSNIALLYFFVNRCNKEGHKREGSSMSPREYMIQTLKNDVGFNDNQIVQYEQLSDKHKEIIKPLFESIRMSKDSLYKLLLQQNIPDSVVDHYLFMIGEKQKSIDQRVFNHFLSIREICTADQRPRFDTTAQKIIKKMIGYNKKGPGKDKK